MTKIKKNYKKKNLLPAIPGCKKTLVKAKMTFTRNLGDRRNIVPVGQIPIVLEEKLETK